MVLVKLRPYAHLTVYVQRLYLTVHRVGNIIQT